MCGGMGRGTGSYRQSSKEYSYLRSVDSWKEPLKSGCLPSIVKFGVWRKERSTINIWSSPVFRH